MGFDTQDIRKNYERMETEELLSITGKELTDISREVLNEVLLERGVSHEDIHEVRAHHAEVQTREAANQAAMASRRVRILAFGIDFFGAIFIIAVVFLPLKIFPKGIYEAVIGIVFWTYFLLRDGIPGQSLGKRLMSIRTEQLSTAKPASFANSFWRNLTHFFFIVDGFFILGKRRMRFGDMLAGTRVIRSKSNL
jgi:uncharacterized RDD family membrane protein YckC